MSSGKVKDQIDLSKVAPLDHHRTAVTFNCFIIKILEILNNFGNDMEEVLERADRLLMVAESKLRLMEVKLSEVVLDDEVPTTSSKPEGAEAPVAPKASDAPDVLIAPKAPEPSEAPSTSSSPPKPDDVPRSSKVASEDVILIKDDPAYSKYFKMLKMGVPEAGVIQKMSSEGVDPSILQRGEEPSRIQKTCYESDSSGDSVSSFSDSD